MRSLFPLGAYKGQLMQPTYAFKIFDFNKAPLFVFFPFKIFDLYKAHRVVPCMRSLYPFSA